MDISLCQNDDIPEGEARGFELPQGKVFVVRKQDRLHIYLNRCPHLGIELEWVEDQFLSSDATLIQCSTHGALFRTNDGYCVRGPCAGASLVSIPLKIENGSIYFESP